MTVTQQVNRPPVAGDDLAATTLNTPVTISVLANDSDPDNDPLAITSTTDPAHGAITQDGQAITYTPAQDWAGTDTFTYTISDDKRGTATATVTVGVVDVLHPQPPIVGVGQLRQERVAGVLMPVCLYYVERYFSGIRQTETDRKIAAILDNSPQGRDMFENMLTRYHALSSGEKLQKTTMETCLRPRRTSRSHWTFHSSRRSSRVPIRRW